MNGEPSAHLVLLHQSFVRMHQFVRIGLLVLVVLSGCSSPVEPPGLAAGPQVISERWDVHYIDDSRIGHMQTVTERIERDDRELIRTTATSEMTIRRFGQPVTMKMRLVSIEDPDGHVVEFESVDPQSIRTVGRCDGNRLHLTVSSAGQPKTTTVPWKRDYGGFFAAEQALVKRPLTAGAQRTIQAFLPVFNQVGRVHLQAIRKESTQLLDGEKRLMKVRNQTEVRSADTTQTIETLLWIDDQGTPFKSYLPQMNMTSYRTTKEVALAPVSTPAFDLGEESSIPVNPPLKKGHETARATYHVRLSESDPTNVFLSCLSQRVRKIDDRTAEIEVRTILGTTPDLPAEEQPEPADLAANNLIQSDDALIVRMAQGVAADETNPWDLARSLETFVGRTIEKKDFSQAFATAADVAKSRQGDCTEHAVLLAALCRARGLPARVAIGLVYVERKHEFAYHMWNEVWIRDHWVPLDATLSRGGIGAGHLKLLDTNLTGADAYSAFLPVIEVIRELKIDVVDQE